VDNERLRAHVTRVGFDLSLGKTHVAALVYLNESLRQRRYIPSHHTESGWHRKAFAHFASGMHGCIDRGLVDHHYQPTSHLPPKERQKAERQGMKRHYTITAAGKHVIALLQEAGIYQEFADALPRLEVVA
jgi:hypothetical protein